MVTHDASAAAPTVFLADGRSSDLSRGRIRVEELA